MSVFIKGMGRVSDCMYCLFYSHGYCNAKHGRCNSKFGIDADCPIIEVKVPHGRLIEVTDKLRSELCWYETYTGIDEAPIKYAVSLIDDAPTVIEAEDEPQTERSE